MTQARPAESLALPYRRIIGRYAPCAGTGGGIESEDTEVLRVEIGVEKRMTRTQIIGNKIISLPIYRNRNGGI